jgi:endonuclease/exonuclease/phosphatase family metal-dependent hydrolase
MRVVSYNILDGGEGRADPVAEVLLAQRADIIGLVEADNPLVVDRLAKRLGMDVVVAAGHGHAVALLTRWPMGDTANLAALLPAHGPRCLLRAELTDPSTGTEWAAGVLHLSPRADLADEERRLGEVRVALEAFADLRAAGRPHLLMGDFNANAPYQRIDPEKCKEKIRASWVRNGGMIPRAVVQAMLDHGYTDTLRAARPGEAETVGSFTTRHPGQRVDYVFTWGVEPGRVRDAWVEQDRLATYASDHYPVACEIA